MTSTPSTHSAVLLINLGSPDDPSEASVRAYLKEFLMDRFVIDLPYLIRKILVSGFILPKRPKESAKAYQSIWWKNGSPLVVLSSHIQQALQKQIDVPVALAMRYGQPSIESSIEELIHSHAIDEILLVPLYPHFAMSTVTTTIEETKRVLRKLNPSITLKVIKPFYNDVRYLDALSATIEPAIADDYDHIVFSYHGLPERHITKCDTTGSHCLQSDTCCQTPSPAHDKCYRAQIYATTDAVVKKLGIPADKYSVAFQSRLGKTPWLQPYTDQTVTQLAAQGVKNIKVVCPAFVADCLETLEEIGIALKEQFIEDGGEKFEMIPCLNTHPLWIDALQHWVIDTPDNAFYTEAI